MFEQKYETLSRTIERWIQENPTDGRLPGVRKFASMFGADKKTVGKAMHLLVRRGVISVNGPQGTFRVFRPGGCLPIHPTVPRPRLRPKTWQGVLHAPV